MSLREQMLQHRVDALEEAVENLIVTIQTHLPSAGGMADNARSAIYSAGAYVETMVAQTLAAPRVARRASHDKVLSNGDLGRLMRIYIPLLLECDPEQRFLKRTDRDRGRRDLSDTYTLDLSSIPKAAHTPVPHSHTTANNDHTRMALRVSNKIQGMWFATCISGTELYHDEWSSYSTEYDGVAMSLFEKELIEAISQIFKVLNRSDAMIDPNFDLHGRNGVNHKLTLSHDTWRREAILLGTAIEGQGVTLASKSSNEDVIPNLRITLWKDLPDKAITIAIGPQHGDTFVLKVFRDQQILSLRKYDGIDQELRPSDLNVLDRARLKLLIEFVVALMRGEHTGTDLSFRDPTGIQVDWDVTVIPTPDIEDAQDENYSLPT